MAETRKKVIITGDSGTGKSCIVLRFAEDSFTESFISTIGVDFRIRSVEADDKTVKLQIWDTAGQERFRTITTAYYRGTDAVIIVFDLTDIESFNNVRNWFEEARRYAAPQVQMFLAGNKSDLTKVRQVQFDAAKKLADEYDALYFELSAKSGDNVQEMFSKIVEKLLASGDSSAPGPTVVASAAPEEPEESGDGAANDTQEMLAQLEQQIQKLLKVKAILVGDSGVGKTNVVSRLTDAEFSKESRPTIGVDFCTNRIHVDNEEVRVQFWDTAGQERFRSLTSSFYRGADAVVIAFDLTSPESFNHVQYWVDSVKQTLVSMPKMILIGNKADLKDARVVDYDDAKAIADKSGMVYLEVSAKDDSNISELKQAIARAALDKAKEVDSAEEGQDQDQDEAARICHHAATRQFRRHIYHSLSIQK